MTELDIFDALTKTTSKNEKREILETNKKNQRLIELLSAVQDHDRKFFTNKIEYVHSPASTQQDLHQQFLDLLNKLETRTIVGNEAKAAREAFFKLCTDQQFQWYRRILKKDLKAGVSDKTISTYTGIPVFEVQLAKDGKECSKAEAIIKKGVYLSPKFDGYRCLAIIENGLVTLHSRNGTVYDNFPTIELALSMAFPDTCVILDGEIMSDDFQAMQKTAFASKSGKTVGDVVFHVFDKIEYSEWQTKVFKQKKSQRYQELVTLSQLFPNEIKLVNQDVVSDMATILAYEQTCIANGFEGAMTCPDIPYYLGKKSNKLLKWKTFKSEDCEVIGFYEGKDDTRNSGRLGGFILKQEDGQSCECGSGFSDEDRDYIWNNQAEFLGRIVEAKYQEKTNHGIMRFPTFVRYRNDKE